MEKGHRENSKIIVSPDPKTVVEGIIALVKKDKMEYKIEKTFLGKDLVGIEYEPLFDNYAKQENFIQPGFHLFNSDLVFMRQPDYSR